MSHGHCNIVLMCQSPHPRICAFFRCQLLFISSHPFCLFAIVLISQNLHILRLTACPPQAALLGDVCPMSAKPVARTPATSLCTSTWARPAPEENHKNQMQPRAKNKHPLNFLDASNHILGSTIIYSILHYTILSFALLCYPRRPCLREFLSAVRLTAWWCRRASMRSEDEKQRRLEASKKAVRLSYSHGP